MIIEIRDQAGRLLDRRQLTPGTYRIGRAYTNECVLDDPYVSPEHCELTVDESGTWEVHDHGSENGTFVQGLNGAGNHGKTARTARAKLSHGTAFRLGQTTILCIDPEAPLAPTLRLEQPHDPFGAFHHGTRSARRTVVALIAALGVCGVGNLMSYTDPDYRLIDGILLSFLSCIGMILPWASIWALLSKVTRHRSYFLKHLTATIWMFVGLTLALFAFDIAAFAADLPALGDGGTYLTYSAALFILLLAHLRYATHQSRRVRRLWAAGITVTAIGVTLMFGWSADRGYSADIPFESRLYPPRFTFAKPQTPADAARSVETLIDELEDEDAG